MPAEKLIKLMHVCIVLKSTFKGFTPQDAAWKTDFFLHRLFLENEAQINKNDYATSFCFIFNSL